jgi:hypothetical protein
VWEIATIFQVNETFTWLREPLLRRLPDGSLCCIFFTGGRSDGSVGNTVAAVRSDDDGETWSDAEVIVGNSGGSAWAPSLVVQGQQAHLFWFSAKSRRYHKENHVLSTGPDGRTFTTDRLIMADWNAERGVDIRHGAQLKDGRFLLPIAWQEPAERPANAIRGPEKRFANIGGKDSANSMFYVGVAEPDPQFTHFQRFGRLCRPTPDGDMPSVPLFENAIAELPDGRLAMLVRGDLTNRLWRADSADGGRTWTTPVKTRIPNPGSKPRILNLSDGRVVLFHNPSEKDYNDLGGSIHRHRTPLEMWISADGMESWSRKDTIIPAPQLAQYPDGFYDETQRCVYLVWEDDRTISFSRFAL